MDSFAYVCDAVRDSLKRCHISGNVLTALSGGADSVVLLLAIHKTAVENGIHLSAAYVHHGLREAAEEEELFCRDLCAALKIPFYVRRVHVSDEGSLESAARAVRYQALFDVLRETGGGVIALAHHMDDQAETMLLHLLYGAGGKGLAGMREYSPPLWRPLLHLRKSFLRTALTEMSQTWMEDETNKDTRFTRNALRLNIVPRLEELFPQAVSAFSRAADIISEENDLLDDLADCWLAKHAGSGVWYFLEILPFASLHTALQRRVLRRYASIAGMCLDFRQTEMLRGMTEKDNGAIINLPGEWQAMRCEKHLHLIPPSASGKEPIWSMNDISVVADPETTGDGIRTQTLPSRMLEGLCIRTRSAGDRIQPFGMHGHMKLKDYMISKGIERPFRMDWPLLCRGGEVLWVIGAGASELLRISEKDKEDAVLLTFTGRFPDEIAPSQEGTNDGKVF